MNMSPKPTANANILFRCTYSRQSCITQTPSSIKIFLLEITDESKMLHNCCDRTVFFLFLPLVKRLTCYFAYMVKRLTML